MRWPKLYSSCRSQEIRPSLLGLVDDEMNVEISVRLLRLFDQIDQIFSCDWISGPGVIEDGSKRLRSTWRRPTPEEVVRTGQIAGSRS